MLGAASRWRRANLPRLDEIRVDLTALLFAIGDGARRRASLFGLAPALQASRVQLVDGLRQGGKGSSIGARGGWARSAFVVAEIALAVVLVAGAGLLARSLAALAAVDMGFTPEHLLVLQTAVPVRGIRRRAARDGVLSRSAARAACRAGRRRASPA